MCPKLGLNVCIKFEWIWEARLANASGSIETEQEEVSSAKINYCSWVEELLLLLLLLLLLWSSRGLPISSMSRRLLACSSDRVGRWGMSKGVGQTNKSKKGVFANPTRHHCTTYEIVEEEAFMFRPCHTILHQTYFWRAHVRYYRTLQKHLHCTTEWFGCCCESTPAPHFLPPSGILNFSNQM